MTKTTKRTIAILAVIILICAMAFSAPAAQAASRKLIGREKAKQIALKRTNGGRVTDCELDYEHGTRVYEIEIRKGRYEYDIDVNAYTGKIVDYDVDYDD